MPEAVLQPFVTSQRQTGVAGKATTTGLAKVWTWQADPNAANQAGPTATSATKPGRRPFNQQNKLGSYYCWNRTYDVLMARWTTPDPAATPWSNLWDYAASTPLRQRDTTGLNIVDLALISNYWRDPLGGSVGLYSGERCEQLLTAIKQARYDLAHASKGLGHGRLPEIITELEKLYAIRCGKPAPPSAYPILPPPYQPGRPCTKSFDDARKAFEDQERRYILERIHREVEGWEFLGNWAKGVALVGLAPLWVPVAAASACTGCGGGGGGSTPVTGPTNVVCSNVTDDMVDAAKHSILKKIADLGPGGVGDAGGLSGCATAFLNAFGNSLRSTHECCKWVGTSSGPEAVVDGKSCLHSLDRVAHDVFEGWRFGCAWDALGGQPSIDQFAQKFMGK